MFQVTSPIQNQIISRLKNANVLRYSELWQKDIPNDLFNYHLQFLVKKGFVDRYEDGYTLSKVGVKHVADFNPTDHNNNANLFKVNVLTVVSRIHEGKLQILNQVRKSNPSFGKVGVMGGVVRKGENVENAATRKLKVETGLDAEFKLVGMQRRYLYVKGEIFSDVFFPIAYSSDSSGDLIVDTEYGHNLWVDIDDALQNESAEFDSIKSLLKVLGAIKEGTIKSLPFLYEEDTQSSELG